MLKVENLNFRYNKFSRPVLNGADLELKPGEIGILLGKNGSGKTTLFKNILGIHKPDSGKIFFEEEDLLKISRKERSSANGAAVLCSVKNFCARHAYWSHPAMLRKKPQKMKSKKRNDPSWQTTMKHLV